MASDKIELTFEREREQMEGLGEVAREYDLEDESKALRVLLDFAIEDGDSNFIFSTENMRCRFCG